MSSLGRPIDESLADSSPPRWHRTGKLVDGTPIGEFGSLRFVIDEDGQPISNGYHDIRYRDGEYVGKIGASWERISFDSRE